jgi:hypothetical protein
MLLLHCCMMSCLFAQTVSGRVFRDYNANGVFDSTAILRENGAIGIRVSAYDRHNALVVSANSDYWGYYTLQVGTNDSLRIEFDNLSAVDFASAVGTDNGSSVQFVVGGATNVHFALNYPAHFSQDTAYFVTPCYINGAVSASGANDVLVHWNYYNTGTVTTKKHTIATKNQIGSTWGVAYSRGSGDVFVSSFVKRHCGLPDLNLDSLGDVANIYTVNVNNPLAPVTQLWLNLTTLGLNFGSIGSDFARGLSNSNTPTRDSTAVPRIAKIGIGGIDLSDDDSTLFVVNLFERKLHVIRVATKTLLYSLDMPNPACTGGTYRPFAVKYYKGKIYVGLVCDAQTNQASADLQAFVYMYDGTAFTQVLNFPLNYARQLYFKNALHHQWLPWRDVFDMGRQTFSASIAVDMQPILADIEFDPNGDGMILALVDRYGHIGGSSNYDDNTGNNSAVSVLSPGDIRYAYKSALNQWTIETGGDKDGASGPFTPRADQTTTLIDRQNNATEFFRDDMLTASGTNMVAHREILSGGLAVLPVHNQVDFIAFDPADISFTGGNKRLNCYDGRFANTYQLYFTPPNTSTTFSKANGLGDLELITAPQPIEIGNRVWVDTDQNGIQDAHEPPLTNLVLVLKDSATQQLIATATTNARGEYFFSSAKRTNPADSSAKHNLNLHYNHAYYIQIQNTIGANRQASTMGLSLTAHEIGNNRGIDNDGILRGNHAEVYFRTGYAGQNNHNYDFGFYPTYCPPLRCLPVAVTRF